MDGQRLQEKINKGRARAAKHIGLDYTLVRPANALNPIAISIGTLKAAFSPDGKYLKPSSYGKPIYRADFDDKRTKVGDYLVRGEDIYFIVGLQDLLPILTVKCNHTITISQAQAVTGIGAQEYGGNTLEGETPILVGWPASVLQGPKGEKSETNLPGDVKNPWWIVLLPYFPGVLIETTYIITDDDGNRYVVSSAERTDMGWRLTAQLQVT